MSDDDDGIGRRRRARIAPCAADLPAQAGDVRARRGRPPVRRRRPRVSRSAVGHRRRGARTFASADSRARSPNRRRRCIHTSNLFYHPLQGQLAERLANLSGLPRAFFCNSGTEAVEACLKFARRYWYTQGRAARRVHRARRIVSRPHVRLALGHVRRALPRAVRAAAAERAVRARQRCRPRSPRRSRVDRGDHRGAGSGRRRHPAAHAGVRRGDQRGVRQDRRAASSPTKCRAAWAGPGYPFYFAALGLKPHLVSVGKALGGGVPIGAALVSQEVADTISYGDHGSTYGGNLLACRAALCVLDELVGGGLLAHIGRVGQHFERRLKAIAAKHSIVKDVRGARADVGPRAHPRRGAGRTGRRSSAASSSIARRRRWCGCCRR